MYRWLGIILLAAILSGLSACLQFNQPFNGLAPGPWRMILQLDPKAVFSNPKGEPLPELLDLSFEEITNGELPFVMEVVYLTPDSFVIDLINGDERSRLSHITIGRDRATAKDTLLIDFPVYDSYIRAVFEEKVMQGEWVVNYKENYRIPLLGKQGKNHRFTTLKKQPVADVSGRWKVFFETDTEHPYPAVGQFQQNGNHLKGTFTTETGDYRFLEGTIQEDKLYLSAFDGAHAFLFEGKIMPDNNIIGSFRSGSHYKCTWTASRDDHFNLSPPESSDMLTAKTFDTSKTFLSPEGPPVSLSDASFAEKPVILYLMGTWCPNCRDATAFLKDYLQHKQGKKPAVLGIAFEKYRDPEKALQKLALYKEKLQIPYPIVLGGYADKKETAETIGLMQQVSAYPTLIFLNANNEVQWIYSGFYGPATTEYDDFKLTFNLQVKKLLGEE